MMVENIGNINRQKLHSHKRLQLALFILSLIGAGISGCLTLSIMRTFMRFVCSVLPVIMFLPVITLKCGEYRFPFLAYCYMLS